MWPRTFFISVAGTGVSPFTISAVLMSLAALNLLVIHRLTQARFLVSFRAGAVGVAFTILFWTWRLLSDYFGIDRASSLKADVLESIYFGSWFLIGMVMFTRDGSSKTLERALTITIVGASVVALFEAATGQSIMAAIGANNVMAGNAYGIDLNTTITERDGVARLRSIFSHPIVFGSFMGALAPLAIHRLIYRSGAGFIAAAILVICIGLSIALANARTSYVVIAVSLTSYFVLYAVNLKRPSGIIIGSMILLGSPLAISAAITQVDMITSGQNADESRSTDARAIQADKAFAAASTRPLSGFGTGMALDVAGIQPEGRYFKTIDNYYLNMLVDYGYVGLAAFAALLVSYVLVGVGAIHNAAASSDRSLLCVALSAILGLAASFFAVSINDALSWIFLLAGFIVARKGSKQWKMQAPPRLAFTGESVREIQSAQVYR
jgi:O-antigen ligase